MILLFEFAFKQTCKNEIKHHYEEETDQILTTIRWNVLQFRSTYKTRLRWIYSWGSCTKFNFCASCQAGGSLWLLSYFLLSSIRQTKWRLSICYLHSAPWAKEWKVCHTTAFHFRIYHIILILVILLRFILFLYIFFQPCFFLSHLSHPCVSLSFEGVFPSVCSENNNLPNETEEKEEGDGAHGGLSKTPV